MRALLFGSLCSLLVIIPAAAAPRAPGKDIPAPKYPLAIEPLTLLDRLEKEKLGKLTGPGPDERKLLAAVWQTRREKPAVKAEKILDRQGTLDAFLFASGVTESTTRAKYRKQYADLLRDARKEVGAIKSRRDKADKLLRFLHKGVMAKGYEAKQSSLAAIFDTGKFNCVSSAALYHLVGTDLGLELRALSIPGGQFMAGHATVDLLDQGKRIEMETTNPGGFDWETKRKRPGVVTFGITPDRKTGKDVDLLGVAAMIYSNRGVDAGADAKTGDWLVSVRLYACALALDPLDGTASHNLTAAFVNRGPKLVEEKKYEEALRALTFGRSVVPENLDVKNNYKVAWVRYIEATLEAGKDRGAVELVGRAGRALPEDADFKSPAPWFLRQGAKEAEKGSWPAGLAVVERGLKACPKSAEEALRKGRGDLYRRWSQTLLDKKDVEGSMTALARGLGADPTSQELAGGIAYHTQEALRILEADKGSAAALAHARLLFERFPKVEGVRQAAKTHALRSIDKLADEKKFLEAVKRAAQYAPMAKDNTADLGALAYDRWARQLAGEKRWKAALDKYGEGLKACPEHARLLNNAVVVVDDWATTAIDAGKWDEAIRIYNVGLEMFPGNGHLKHNLEFCVTKKGK